MLISFPHRFVFIKTVKTAGTSVEAFLEPYCCPPGHIVRHWTPTLTSDYGIVGRRWPQNDLPDFGYYNHMPACEIRTKFPDYDSFTRITTVRDPFDRAVSMFHYSHDSWRPVGGIPLQQAVDWVSEGSLTQLRSQFLYFLQHSYSDDDHLLTINGQLAVDRWVRYEHLHADLEQLVLDLKLPLEGSVADHLPVFKQNRYGRADAPAVDFYLSPAALDFIHQHCAWSLSTFGYPMRVID